MENGEWTGVVIAAVLALLTFGVTRFVVRRITGRRVAKQQAVEQPSGAARAGAGPQEVSNDWLQGHCPAP